MNLAKDPSGILTTRIFRSGNSLSVRIPSSMVPPDVPRDAEIEYKDGVWTIRPVHHRKLTGLSAKFRAFSPGFMAAGRAPQTQTARDWSGAGAVVKVAVRVADKDVAGNVAKSAVETTRKRATLNRKK